MEIQWSLVLFTALTGMGGCLFACVAADEFLGRAKNALFPASIAAFALAVIGGFASVTHLSHPDRMLAALSHPTSGIFTEALLVGCLCVCIAIYVILLKRGASATVRKVVAVIGAVFGLLLSFMAGESYLMDARPNWNTQLLPLGYLLTAVPEGIAAWLVIVGVKAKDADVAPYAKALLVAGILAVLSVAAYVLTAGASDGTIWALFALAVVGAGVVPAVCGAVLPKFASNLTAVATAAVVCAFVGTVAYRCIMWLITVPVANLFLSVL